MNLDEVDKQAHTWWDRCGGGGARQRQAVLSPPLSRWAAMAPGGPATRPVGSSAVVPGTALCEVLALSASPLSCVSLWVTQSCCSSVPGLRVCTWNDPAGPGSAYPLAVSGNPVRFSVLPGHSSRSSCIWPGW